MHVTILDVLVVGLMFQRHKITRKERLKGIQSNSLQGGVFNEKLGRLSSCGRTPYKCLMEAITALQEVELFTVSRYWWPDYINRYLYCERFGTM